VVKPTRDVANYIQLLHPFALHSEQCENSDITVEKDILKTVNEELQNNT
jgi:hypothetical protein